MSTIQPLNEQVIDQIAAGEVVERPASVLKELIDNAIDAGAKNIDIRLEQGGTNLISVEDDGGGIAADQLDLALQRHATSKIRRVDDLFKIGSHGFRGEALSSIASVAKLTLQSRQASVESGASLKVDEHGKHQQPWAGRPGTNVTVQSLFYNVPARKKFLKAPTREWHVCLEWVRYLSLVHPEVSFVLIHNGKEHFRSIAATSALEKGDIEQVWRQRAQALLGIETTKKLQFLDEQGPYGRWQGLMSTPELHYAHSKHMVTFVNRRWIKDRSLRFAIQRGFQTHILKGRYPLAFVHLTCDPSLVDINVHPAKTEVRLEYAEELQSMLSHGIRKVIRAGAWATPKTQADSRPDKSTGTYSSSGSQESHESSQSSELGMSSVPNGAEAPARPQAWPAPSARLQAQHHTSQPAPRNVSFDTPAGLNENLRTRAVSAKTDSNQRERPSWQTHKATFSAPGEDVSPSHARKPGTVPQAKALLPEPAIPDRQTIGKLLQEALYIGCFRKCFLLFEVADRLLVIDQHAFHERVLFERLLNRPEAYTKCQPLLVPEAIHLTPELVGRLQSHQTALEKLGFRFAILNDDHIECTGLPVLLSQAKASDVTAAMGRLLHEHADSHVDFEDLHHDICSTMACHAAIRAGEQLSETDIQDLAVEAAEVDFDQNCPHGRPVYRWWSKGQVERWFDR